MWAQAFSSGEATDGALAQNSLGLGITCLSRATSLNEIIKSWLYARANLIELFKLVQDISERQFDAVRVNNRKMFSEEKMHQQGAGADEIQDGYHIRGMIVHNPFLEDLSQTVSTYAFEHMLF